MSTANPLADGFFERAPRWRDEMLALRHIILEFPLTEELKWSKPCYTFQESNLLILQPFKEYCALMFCKGALLKDAEGFLTKPGENTQAGRQLRFTGVPEITALKSTVRAYIAEAIDAEKAGRKVTYKEPSDFSMPEELQKKLDDDPAFKKAFSALTPGRQRGYVLYISTAKQPKTREARVEKCRPQILAGNGLHDYQTNERTEKPTASATSTKDKSKKTNKSTKTSTTLLSGGNPQIAKADGDAPVQAYITAMPGWKRGIGQRLDALIGHAIPEVRKAVKWNSPFYGVEGQGWFLSFHVFTRYVKVTFFRGASLRPVPPGYTDRSGDARWIDIFEAGELDEAQWTAWVRQAAALPGWTP